VRLNLLDRVNGLVGGKNKLLLFYDLLETRLRKAGTDWSTIGAECVQRKRGRGLLMIWRPDSEKLV